MKIGKAIRDCFNSAEPDYELLSKEVGEVLRPHVEAHQWFYVKRVKRLESFALKVETGRVPAPSRMEDFFACTLVIPTLSGVEEAERVLLELFDLHERRPPNDQSTSKTPSDFRFDDLRLYLARRPAPSGRNSQLDGLVFEVQIKTVLQYAWSIATHDLIYKTDTVSWAKERIAFQVKAMLEHAEIAIAEAERLSTAMGVSKRDDRTTEILQIIEQLRDVWSPELLPSNLKRLAETILDLLRIVKMGAADFRPLLEGERRRIGLLPSNLSPYSFTLQALMNSRTADLATRFAKARYPLVLQDGMEVPDWVPAGHQKIIDMRPSQSADSPSSASETQS